jgi:uncharacterized membrane protein
MEEIGYSTKEAASISKSPAARSKKAASSPHPRGLAAHVTSASPAVLIPAPAGRDAGGTSETQARRLWARLTTPAGQLRLAWGLTIALIVAYAVILGGLSLLRYWTFQSTAFDLGNMDQVVWNTLHGHFFAFTNRGKDYFGPPTRLAVHVEPILLPLSLLYLIYAGPETLLIAQTLALALGGLAVFVLARRALPRWPLVGVALVATYLASPLVIGENIFDFHPVALATPLLLAAVLALDARRHAWFALAALLATMSKEDIGFTVALLGLYIAFGQRRRWFGLTTAALALGWSLLCFLVILPANLHGYAVGNNFWQRYAELGSTPGQAMLHLMTQPWLFFTVILTLPKLGYIGNLLMTAGFLGLLAPLALLPALPELAINILSNQPEQYTGVYHYNSVLAAFLLVAGVLGCAKVARHFEQDRDGWAALSRFGRVRALLGKRFLWRRVPRWGWWLALKAGAGWAWVVRRVSPRVAMSVLVALLLLVAARNLLAAEPFLQQFWPPLSVGTREAQINQLLAQIPPDASVSASDTLDPHLGHRAELYLFPDLGRGTTPAQYIVIDVDHLQLESRVTSVQRFDLLIASGEYRVIAQAGSVYLAELQGDSASSSQKRLTAVKIDCILVAAVDGCARWPFQQTIQ